MINTGLALKILTRITVDPAMFDMAQPYTHSRSLRTGQDIPPDARLDLGAWTVHLSGEGYTLTDCSFHGVCLDPNGDDADITTEAARLLGIDEDLAPALFGCRETDVALAMLRQVANGNQPNTEAAHRLVGQRRLNTALYNGS